MRFHAEGRGVELFHDLEIAKAKGPVEERLGRCVEAEVDESNCLCRWSSIDAVTGDDWVNESGPGQQSVDNPRARRKPAVSGVVV